MKNLETPVFRKSNSAVNSNQNMNQSNVIDTKRENINMENAFGINFDLVRQNESSLLQRFEKEIKFRLGNAASNNEVISVSNVNAGFAQQGNENKGNVTPAKNY